MIGHFRIRRDVMRNKASCTVLAAAALLAAFTTMAAADNDLCCEFVRRSVAFQIELAKAVKELNQRAVYLFDATGFTAGFTDASTPLNVRYKTGAVNGTLVDAVLSVSAQRTLGGEAGARTYYTWTGGESEVQVDERGVRI